MQNSKSLNDTLIDKSMAYLRKSCFPIVFKETMDNHEKDLCEAAEKGKFYYQFDLRKFRNELKKNLSQYQIGNQEYQHNVVDANNNAMTNHMTLKEYDSAFALSIDDLPWRNFVIDYILNIWHLDIEDPTNTAVLNIRWNIPINRFEDAN